MDDEFIKRVHKFCEENPVSLSDAHWIFLAIYPEEVVYDVDENLETISGEALRAGYDVPQIVRWLRYGINYLPVKLPTMRKIRA